MSTFDRICARIAVNDPDIQNPGLLWFAADDEQTIQVASALITNTFIKSLPISIRRMGIESARELARVLRANKTIRALRINCQDNDECARELISVLNVNTTIDSLTLAVWNCEDAIRAIEQVIATSKTLRTLAIDSIHHRVDGVISAIRANMSITNLNLSNCAFDKHALFDILSMQTTTIKELNLSNTFIGDKDAREFTRILLTNTTLTRLSLSLTDITQQGAREIAHALRINRTLLSLDLNGCRMRDDGIIAIANALTNANHTLENLRVSNCRIASVGIGAIARMLRANTTLATLDISKNAVGQAEALVLTSALEANSTLCFISVCNPRSSRACGKRTWILQEAFASAVREQRRKEGLRAIVRATRDPHSPLSILPGDGMILRDICRMCKVPPVIITHQ